MSKPKSSSRPEVAVDTVVSQLKKIGYELPTWCRMHPLDHGDGFGGCWGISYGDVKKEGEKYCLRCEYYKAG